MNARKQHTVQYRIALLVSLTLITVLGFWSKFYRGIGQELLNNSLSSIPYEIFWILLIVFLFPKVSPRLAAIAIFLVTSGFEVLQLWQPAWLQAIRATLPGRLLLGNSFTWSDFFFYLIGCAIGWIWVEILHRKFYQESGHLS
jgi:Protein of unknown function (DUF2809)